MPIYEYRCENGHDFEVMQRMSDDPLTSCEVCGATVQKVLSPVAVHFKGSGFYTTDYGKKKGAGGDSKGAESGGGSDSGGGSESGGGSGSESGSGSSGSDSGSSSGSKDAKSSGSKDAKSSAAAAKTG